MKHKHSYAHIAKFGRELLDLSNINLGLPVIADYAKDVIHADRCSIFIYNPNINILWTTLSDGIEKIILNSDEGIVGETVRRAEPIIVNDPYNDERFYQKVDHKSGYITKDIASVPIFDSNRKVLGVMQLLNSLDGDGFDSDDIKFMVFFAHYISGYLELSSLMGEEEELIKLNNER